ncbi:hypothetical protein LshimejAT787_0308880 [Lyophyllum shimeji]|uniref:Uncharacterized protein n=1 Tax=Lyophyllum shimeji TaxID=47721 RepID=A0A9P3PI63_LYOSH|nr:hypothetical protein LshimejAT787_0308880 [Lyophyllum shimeji]
MAGTKPMQFRQLRLAIGISILIIDLYQQGGLNITMHPGTPGTTSAQTSDHLSPLPTPNVISEIDQSNGPAFPVAETPRYTLDPSSPRSSTVQPKGSKLSFAQQLYASASKPSQTYTPPSITIPTIPTPPVSPRPNSIQRTTPYLPSPPSSSGNIYASSGHSASEFHHQVVSSQRPQAGAYGPDPSLNSHPSHHTSSAHYAPHRAQSYQPPQASHQQISAPHRASSYPASMMSTPKPTPNLTTTLRPPPNASLGQSQNKPDTTPSLQTIATPPPHLQPYYATNTNVTIAAPMPSYPSPPNSASPATLLNASGHSFQQPVPFTPTSPPQFVQQNNTMLTQPSAAAPAPVAPPQLVQQNYTIQTQASTATTVAPQYQQQPQTASHLGQAVGAFAMGMAGGAVSAAFGTQHGTEQQASEQQYQVAWTAHAQQMSAMAAQEAAQAQQTQALLQAYQQQQQQQLQLQLQQQQALQQQQLQQQFQQMQAALGQQSAQTQQTAPQGTPLGVLMHGLGHALSNLGDSGNGADTGAAASDAGGGVLSFLSATSSDNGGGSAMSFLSAATSDDGGGVMSFLSGLASSDQ